MLLAASCMLLASARNNFAQQSPKELKVWDFDTSLTSALGGKYNVFQRSPSAIRSYLDPAVHLASSRHSLRITAHREAKGFCGVWFDFYPTTDLAARYVDASAYPFLTFWVKGEKGGEDFDITLKDDTWRNHEDVNPTRKLGDYLRGGATTDWKEVRIPLADFKGLNARRLYNLTFHFTHHGDQQVFVDDIAFSATGPAAAEQASAAPAESAPEAEGNNTAMWVWKTAKLLDPANHADLDDFFTFCSKQKIHQIYLSLEIHLDKAGDAPHYTVQDADRYQAFLERAHKLGMKVAALSGTPEWAARKNHAHALADIDAVIEFNRARPEQGRFDAVHFDVEPYSLVGYADPDYRPQLLREFLEMVSKCVERAHTFPGLQFSCDVPAWFYPKDMLGRQDLMVDFNGAEKTVGEHLTDLLDTVTIMDYRNEADGAGGIIMGGMPALEYAASRGKRIQVGLETSIESERSIYFICGLPLEEFRARLAKSDLRDELYFGDYRISTLSDDINIHLGLAAPEHLDEESRLALQKSLAKLALEMGASSDPKQFPPDETLDEARFAVQKDSELTGFEPVRFADPVTLKEIIGFKTERRMSPKITFYGLSRETFEEESKSVIEWLSPFKSFDGLAIHYYESYRDLMTGK